MNALHIIVPGVADVIIASAHADINGVAGTYQVDVSDKGEPGRRDIFRITLSTGYTAGGSLPGGNIQLHKPCR